MEKGQKQSEQLRENVENQLTRLLVQLQDLEEAREDFESEEEYNAARADTIMQLEEIETRLSKMMSGDITLVSSLGSIQLATQAAIRSSFKSLDTIRLFAKKETGALRSRLAALEEDLRLSRVSEETFFQFAGEVTSALEKLGEPLSARETELATRFTKSLVGYAAVAEGGEEVSSRILEEAKK